MNISDEWGDAHAAVLTGEEILVYAGVKGLGIPPGMEGLPLDGVSQEGLEQRFSEAARTLVSRGVIPHEDGTPDGSELGAMLDVLCGADTVIGVSRPTEDGRADRQYALKGDRVIGHCWDDRSFHLMADLSGKSIDELVRHSAGIEADPSTSEADDQPSASFTFSNRSLQEAAKDGEEATAKMLATALQTAGLDPEIGKELASAMAAGRNVSTGFRSVRGDESETVVIGWLDTGKSGLWSLGAGADDDTTVCNRIAPEDVAANLIEARRRVASL